jgi:two-component system sensor histidine kinase KdpD
MAAATLISHADAANEVTAGFLYLIAVLGLATWGGWAIGAVASVVATLFLNFFFMPPVGTLTVHDPDNWVALACFLASSALVSHLVARARQEASEAQGRQRELQALYDLSFGLFTASQRPGGLGEAAARTLRAIGSDAGALMLDGGEPVSAIGEELDLDAALIEGARQSSGLLEGDDIVYIPLHVGEAISGVLAAREPTATRAVLEPAGRLLALAIERERLLREAAHLEAVRESDTLKTALLRAVSHDLRTPLTSMRLEVEGLERGLADRPEALAGLHRLSREQARLTRRIDNLLALARLEAGVARPHPEPTPAGSLLHAAQESLALVLAGRQVEMRIAPGCPDLLVDPNLTLEVLVNLLENAARASQDVLELAAAPPPGQAAGGERVWLEVLDRGPGPPVAGYSASGGLGLLIARSLAEVNRGSLALLERPGGGTVARLDLPAVSYEEVEE